MIIGLLLRIHTKKDMCEEYMIRNMEFGLNEDLFYQLHTIHI